MPQAIPLIVAAVATYGGPAGAAWFTATQVIAIQLAAAAAAAALSAQQASAARRRAATANARDLTVTLQSSAESRRTVYGRAKVGGPLVYATTHMDVGHNKFLSRLVAVADHEIDAWEKFYFNDDELSLFGLPSSGEYFFSGTGGKYSEEGLSVAAIEAMSGTNTQAALAGTIAASGGQWTADHRLQGVAYFRAQTNYTPNVYTEGLPNPSAVIRGKKIYDPRTGTTYWSRNPALVILDYLMNALDVLGTSIDDASFIAAANICDEYVTLDAASTGDPAGWTAYLNSAVTAGTWELVSGTVYRQRRYTLDGIVLSDVNPGNILEQMVLTCAGYLSYTGGVYRLVAGSYTAPTLTITEKDLRGPISVRPKPGRRERFNEARGTFVGPLTNYVASDFNPEKSPEFLAADNGFPSPMDLDLPFTNDSVMAQRIARIMLMKSRQGVVSVQCTLTALALRPGDTVALTVPALGFISSVFKVESWKFTEDFGIDLQLREEAAALYDWTPFASIKDPSPNMNLPTPWVVPDIVGLAATSGVAQAIVQNDGSIVSRVRVSWATTGDTFQRFVEIETQATGIGETTWTAQPRAVDENGATYVLNLQTGILYTIRARRVNTVGAVGFWASVSHVVLDVNAVDNLLSNSDWTEDLGTPPGTGYPAAETSLRYWNGPNSGLAAVTYSFGRNWAAGTYYNIGPGGSFMYTGARVAGGFLELQQIFPIQPEAEYEMSAYVSAHRCKAELRIRWLNSSQGYISDGPIDSVDAGNGALAGPFDPLVSHPRLWGKGISPVGAVFALIQLRHYSTNAGPDSFTLWSKSLACVAPVGVTRNTATPWIISEVETLRGLGVPVVSNAAGGNGDWGVQFSTTYTWTTKTSLAIGMRPNDTILIDVEYQGSSGSSFGSPRMAGAGIHVNQGGGTWNVKNSKVNETSWIPQASADAVAIKCQQEFTWTSSTEGSVTVHGAGGAHFAAAGTGNGRVLLRVYRVKH